MKQYKFLIACGGTGGHVFPAIALAESIKKDSPQTEILFAGVFKNEIEEILKNSGFATKKINAGGAPRGFNLSIFPFFIKTIGSLLSACRILKNYSPGVVISMGSFSGGPFVIAGKLMRLPVLIHEQNVSPGRGNRLSAYFADKIATSFEATADFFSKSARRKIVCTGNPVRNEILNFDQAGGGNSRGSCLQYFGFDQDKFTILVMGGSQGSHAINRVFIDAAEQLDKDKFQVLHLCGKSDLESANDAYQKYGIKNKTFRFFADIAKAYAAADLVISRSGAISVSEINSLGLASILIPYPYGDAHQRENANVLKKAGAAIIIEEDSLTKDILSATILQISRDKIKLGIMRKNSKALARLDAAENLKKEVLALFFERAKRVEK